MMSESVVAHVCVARYGAHFITNGLICHRCGTDLYGRVGELMVWGGYTARFISDGGEARDLPDLSLYAYHRFLQGKGLPRKVLMRAQGHDVE